MRIVVPAGAYLAALSSRLNSTCSNSTASSSSIGRSAASSSSTRVLRQDLAGAPQRAADDLAEIVQRGVRHDRAGLELGHVEQVGDEAVEPLGFVDDGRQQLGLLARRSSLPPRSRSVPAEPSTAASGVFRSCEIEVSSAERSRSVSTVRLTRSMSSTRARARSPARPGRSAHRAAAAGPASAAAPACRCRCRRRRSRRARCASAGTAAWRPAACRSRGRPGRSFSQAHFAAARSASSSVSSGG